MSNNTAIKNQHENISNAFKKFFFTNPTVVASSPGRINLIGEHTDYNNGFVLPAAIDKSIEVAISKRADRIFHLHSIEFSDSKEISIDNLFPQKKEWTNYILGVVDQLIKTGYAIEGFNLMVDGNIPIGAGLSSSAAVECAVVFALNELYQLGLTKIEMVLIAQKSEHEFAGVKCGIMDMFASMFGKKGHVIKLNCQSLEYEYFPLDLKGYVIVLMDTQVKHSLATSEYNVRRTECEQGVQIIQQKYPEVQSLSEASIAQVEACLADGNIKVYHRCKYVVEEITRLLQGTIDLQNGHIKAFGKKMFETHAGLSNLYEVSCPELDILVEAVRDNPAIIGARMMGGGFGGCTINLVEENSVDDLINNISILYKNKTGKTIKAWKVNIEDGTHLVLPV